MEHKARDAASITDAITPYYRSIYIHVALLTVAVNGKVCEPTVRRRNCQLSSRPVA